MAWPRWAVLVALVATLSCARQPAAPPSAPPRLAGLIQELSESGGYFDTDNLISNESAYLTAQDRLATVGPGGVYLGVGPDQNYSYIAALRPHWAFILDIRRQNMLQHLLFNAFLEKAESPRGYLCLLLARPCGDDRSERWQLDAGLAALEAIGPSRKSFEQNLRDAFTHIQGRLGLPLSDNDRAAIRAVYTGFFEGQLDLRFQSYGRPMMLHHPTYRSLLLARSPGGRGSFLSSPASYRVVRELTRSGRLVPVVGDFAGKSALRAIGRFASEHGEPIRAFYVSNVEFYLLDSGAFERYVENVRTLPIDEQSLFVRACFHYGADHPARLPGHRSTTVSQKMTSFLSLFDAGAYRTYWDVCTRDYDP
jgi:hypothetical protein